MGDAHSLGRKRRWTEPRIAEARALAANGLSASQIGRRMGVSRNSVVGAHYRYGIGLCASPGRPRREAWSDEHAAHVAQMLAENGGGVKAVAHQLGRSLPTFYRDLHDQGFKRVWVRI